ncbi:MAG TPA: S8 family peptidase [Clostridia bacterium]|nr:S8 family peptidase [Clostridia bacterium]
MLEYKDIVEDSVIERLSGTEEEEIPVIICGKDCVCDDLEKHVLKMGGRIKHTLPIINAVAAYIPSVGVKNMATKDITEKIYLDDNVYKLMDITSVTVGSDFANEYGLTGKNVSVAVLDTGVFPHEDLTTPYNRIIGFKDFIGQKDQTYDGDGHGTHVAGIVAGNGFSSKGRYMGIAPDANIVSVKVLKDDGSGKISDVIAGIQWAINNREVYNIKVITLSLGTKPKNNYKDDPLCQAVDAASAFGITVTVAAGNSGPRPSTITSPAISPNVITVGACNDREASHSKNATIANFSSVGPTQDGFEKPDVLAPGVGINSLANKSLEYKELSGTSMATPVVAGCAALLYEKYPEMTPSQMKEIIVSNAVDLGLDPNIQGSGLLNIEKIINSIKEGPPESSPDIPHIPDDITEPFLSRDTFLVILLVIIILNL